MADQDDIRASAERLLRRVSYVSKRRATGEKDMSLEDSIRALQETHAFMKEEENKERSTLYGSTSGRSLGTLGENASFRTLANTEPVESDASDDEEVAETAEPAPEKAVEEAADMAMARRSSFAIPITEEELRQAGGTWGEDSWQRKALGVLHSGAVQNVLISLLLLDVLVLFAQLALESFFPSCENVVQNAISCCPVSHDGAGADAHRPEEAVLRILMEGGDNSHGHGLCAAPLTETGYEAGCDPHAHPGVELTHEVLFWASIAILGTFEVELFLSAFLAGPSILHVLDWVVVTASLSLELAFRFASVGPTDLPGGLVALPGILVVFRFWRFVRIGHGVAASSHKVQEHEMQLAMKHLDEVEARMKRHGVEVPERPEKLRKRDN